MSGEPGWVLWPVGAPAGDANPGPGRAATGYTEGPLDGVLAPFRGMVLRVLVAAMPSGGVVERPPTALDLLRVLDDWGGEVCTPAVSRALEYLEVAGLARRVMPPWGVAQPGWVATPAAMAAVLMLGGVSPR